MRRMRLIAIAVMLVACKPKPPNKPDPRVAQLEKELADTKAALDKEHQDAEALRSSDAELKAKADEAAALEAKLAEAVGKAGEVTTADGAVKLELVDQILFPVGEADLTPRGKEVLAKVGAALKDINDKQIWVQGHTDDQPILVKKPKAEPPKPEPKKAAAKPPKKGAKDAKPDPKEVKAEAKPEEKPAETNDAVLPFVTNWELSAARALTVVHYLQDEAKIDPTRLAAVAFSQYRPVSKNRAKNRRIEIVLYPRAKISPK
ncbi:MAG TPA: OmpA family protein [Kofleriaceae bacterium]|nr:OmpA family protein [Kofleriaceae bacterium]